MIKKILTLALLITSMGAYSLTNQQIIDQGAERQKQVFDRVFNNNSGKTGGLGKITRKDYRKDSNLLNKVYPEIIEGLFNRNKEIHAKELSRLEDSKDESRKPFRPLFLKFNEYNNKNVLFLKSVLLSFLEDKSEYQSYIYTMTYIGLENFYLNLNTVFEAQKNEAGLDADIDTVISYLYHTGDSRSKEDYMKIGNEEMKKLVNSEFEELSKKFDRRMSNVGEKQKKAVNTLKNNMEKMRKLYEKYDESFEEYVDTLDLNPESREKIKKLVKFEKLSELKFILQTI